MLGWPTDKLREWLKSCPSDENFNWLTLGEGASMAALSSAEDVDRERRVVLGDVAYYALKQALKADPKVRVGALASEIVLRAGLIHQLGAESGTLRDEQELLNILIAEISGTDKLQVYVKEGPIGDLTKISVGVLRKLRHIKNVLHYAELPLNDSAADLPDPISWWWSRRMHLP